MVKSHNVTASLIKIVERDGVQKHQAMLRRNEDVANEVLANAMVAHVFGWSIKDAYLHKRIKKMLNESPK